MALRRIQQRKERRQKVVMSIVLSFLMVASGFGIYLSGRGAEQNNIKDFGLTFAIDRDQQLYQTKINGEKMQFYFLPSSVQTMSVDEQAVEKVRSAQAAVITFSPSLDELNLQAIDIVRYDIATIIQKPIINAVTNDSSAYALPLMTCANATAELPVITMVVAEEPSIASSGNCITLAANNSGFLEVRDRFLYEYFEIYAKS